MLALLQRLNVIIPTGGLTIQRIILSLLLSFILGLIISFVYRKTNKGFSYEGSFNFTLIMVCIIVSAIMMAIGSNIALSLGLIGSLSIIRFRTVIKNTVDMAYLFWSIAVGLAVGAQVYYMAIIVVVLLGIIIFLLNKFNFLMKSNTDYVMVVQMSSLKEKGRSNVISNILTKKNLVWKIKSSYINNTDNVKEVTYSIHHKKSVNLEELLTRIRKFDFVERVSLLSPESNLFI